MDKAFVKCACAITAKCSTKRCSCKEAGISCSSKCHGKSDEAKCENTDQAVKEGDNLNEEEVAKNASIEVKKNQKN